MPHRTFFWFILPSAVAMLLFIALPIGSVLVQSLHIEHPRVMNEVETCGPFKCTTEMRVDVEATAALRAEEPLGRFNGLGTYTNRAHLAVNELSLAWRETDSVRAFLSRVYNYPFYKALLFTLTYTFVVTPLVLVLGFFIAVAVNALPKLFKGPVIFFSLLPMIVTPLIGSLILFWMIDAEGIIGASLQRLFDDPDLSLKASPVLTWVTLMVYGVWHSAPFAFVVFYAGLQTVPQDTLESAMIDGASRWERIRYVVIPYLTPLVTFVALIQLMDNFRVFEPIVGFNASANATSLSWLIFNDLRGQEQLFGSAAATSMLTIVGVSILLLPVLVRTWRDFNRRSV
ncbi:MAG: sugar ABC transporter permease [Gammaproteobacteria bacterium]|nr:sugar ABC transporter permease [Gammaproteobacteria bacterium]